MILQFNPGPMIFEGVLIFVLPPIVFAFLMIRAYLKKKRKKALWFLVFVLLYFPVVALLMYVSNWANNHL